MVRTLRFTAIRALNALGRLQGMMRTAHAALGGGGLSLRYGHNNTLLLNSGRRRGLIGELAPKSKPLMIINVAPGPSGESGRFLGRSQRKQRRPDPV